MMSADCRTRGWNRRAGFLCWALAALFVSAEQAHAQSQDISVFAPYVAFTSGGDTRKYGATFGFSTAYIEESGWGGEFDVGYVTDFNDIEFESTSIATMMFNLVAAPRLTPRGVWPMVRPFAIVGLGLIRARGCDRPSCVTEFSRTDLGLNVGGGGYVHINDIWGLRGDVRYFRYAQIHQDLPRTHNGQFDFWRFAAAGVVTW